MDHGAAPDLGRADAELPSIGSLTEERGTGMRTVGVIASSLVIAGALVATAVAVRSVPDVRHYLRLRKM